MLMRGTWTKVPLFILLILYRIGQCPNLLFERKSSKVILSEVEGYFKRLSWFDGVYPAASGAHHDFVGKLGHCQISLPFPIGILAI
jgi:hypothetical protein